jgi:beta-glucosidase/6-phospho-beta-glucosidase/beta-galactosidase
MVRSCPRALSRPICTVSPGLVQCLFRGHKSKTEPWIVGHNQIVAHASAAKLYINNYKPKQNGIIGITLNGDWAEPYDDSPESKWLILTYRRD